MSYYHPPPPPHLPYGYQGPPGQRPAPPPFYVNGQQPPMPPNGAFYQNQNLPSVNPQSLGQNMPQHQQFMSQFQSGSLPPPPYPAPPQAQYHYPYQQPPYPPSAPVQQMRPMQPQPAVSVPQSYGYSGPTNAQAPPAYSPSYGFPRMAAQSTAHAPTEATSQNKEPDVSASASAANNTEAESRSEEANAFRPDFSSIIQEPVAPSKTPHVNIPPPGESSQPAARTTNVSHDASEALAPSHHPNLSPKYSSALAGVSGLFPSSKNHIAPKEASMAGNHLTEGAAEDGSDSTTESTSMQNTSASHKLKKDQAKGFIALLLHHGMGYSDLAKENLDLEMLKDLYVEMGIVDVEKPGAVKSQEAIVDQAPPLASSTALDVPQPTQLTTGQSQSSDVTKSPQLTAEVPKRHQSQVTQAESAAPSSATADTTARRSPAPASGVVKISDPAPLAPQTALPTASQTTSQPTTNEQSAAASKREAYIARLKAARAGQSDKSPGVAAKEPAQESRSQPLNGAAAQPISKPSTELPKNPTSLDESNNTSIIASVVQNKRQAQTELARLKMEALNKSKVIPPRESSPATSGGIPGLTLVSTAQDPTSANQPLSTQPPASNAPQLTASTRKRPVAADFDDLMLKPANKKPFGLLRNEDKDERCVIEASESEDDAADVGADEAVKVNQLRSSARSADHRDLPQLTDLLSRTVVSTNNSGLGSPATGMSPSVQTPAVATPGPAPTPVDLDAYNARIELMKKKIILMEQKRKMQKGENSRPQTPMKTHSSKSDVLPSSSPPAPSTQTMSDSAVQSSTQLLRSSAAQASLPADTASQKHQPNAFLSKIHRQQSTDRLTTATGDIGTSSPSAPQLGLRAGTMSPAVQSESERKRRAEIQSKLSTFNAAAEAKKARLEQLRREMEEIEEQSRKEEQERANLAAELESLGIDTEGMPTEEMQAKRDEIIQQQESKAPMEAEQQSGEAANAQIEATFSIPSNGIKEQEAAIGIPGLIIDNGIKTTTPPMLSQYPPASQSPRSIGDDAMVIDDSTSGDSLEEGELSDDTARAPEDTQEAKGPSPSRMEHGSGDPMTPLKDNVPASSKRDSPEIESSAAAIDNTHSAAARGITSSPASSSSGASTQVASTANCLQLANEATLPVPGLNNVPWSGITRTTSVIREFNSSSAGQGTIINEKPVDNVVRPASGSGFATAGGHFPLPMVGQSNFLEPDVTMHDRVVGDDAASAPISDNDSDLYPLSDPDVSMEGPSDSRDNNLSTTSVDNSGFKSYFDEDDADDDDFYEPPADLPTTAPEPPPQSTTEPTQPHTIQAASQPDHPSDDVAMDVDSESDAGDDGKIAASNQVSLTAGRRSEGAAADSRPESSNPDELQLAKKYLLPVRHTRMSAL
ncbi:MAG: hypothetical protein M1822_001715 [Bathelium mastoideum]|nr:MAG: hypothetical protein M1822_001715 [Bathelium mastoideum]